MRSMARIAAPGALAVAFAVHVGLAQHLTGRLHAAALTTALALGALFGGVLVAARPVDAVSAMSTRARVLAGIGGLLSFAGAPGLVAAVRLSDAPAGAVTVFWIAGGWAALSAVLAAGIALRLRSSLVALWSLVGAGLVLAGCAAVVASWERPSSFSPLERFPMQEVAILLAGLLFVAGGLLVVRAARGSGLGGALVCGGLSAVLASGVWWAFTGLAKGWSSLGELPVEVALAAVAWSVVSVAWPFMLRRHGAAHPAALLAAAPVLLSGLVLVEQAVGVAGPQPMIFTGLLAGSCVLVVGMLALLEAGRPQAVVWTQQSVTWLSGLPAVLAAVALALPSIVASAEVSGAEGAFSGSWTMPGTESVAAWSALALALVVLAAVRSERPWWPVVGALLACMTLPWLASTPTHVLNGWLAPNIQQYYGTEYGSITFASIVNPLLIAAVLATGIGLVAVTLVRAGVVSGRRPAGPR